MRSLTIDAFTDPADRTTFEISCDRFGHWCARRVDGLVFGIFLERENAMRFARRESGPHGSVRIDPAICRS